MLFFFLSAEHLSHHQSARAYMLSWYELNNRQVLCICLDGGRNRALVLCVIASLSGKTHTLHCSWKKASQLPWILFTWFLCEVREWNILHLTHRCLNCCCHIFMLLTCRTGDCAPAPQLLFQLPVSIPGFGALFNSPK